jgi:hypothetical protein
MTVDLKKCFRCFLIILIFAASSFAVKKAHSHSSTYDFSVLNSGPGSNESILRDFPHQNSWLSHPLPLGSESHKRTFILNTNEIEEEDSSKKILKGSDLFSLAFYSRKLQPFLSKIDEINISLAHTRCTFPNRLHLINQVFRI